jgi:protein SCO1/2
MDQRPASRRRALTAAGLALAALAALGGGWWAMQGPPAGVQLPPGQSLEVAQLEALRPLPAFSLARLGGRLAAADLQGRWSFVFFGYTNCPEACPETLGILSHVQESLQAQGQTPPRVVFVSLDPQRDTPQLLHDYLAEFAGDAVGATGSDSELRDLTAFFGVSYERHPGADSTSYTLDHTTNFFLVTPDGRWLATFAPADDPDAVLGDTRTLLGARW